MSLRLWRPLLRSYDNVAQLGLLSRVLLHHLELPGCRSSNRQWRLNECYSQVLYELCMMTSVISDQEMGLPSQCYSSTSPNSPAPISLSDEFALSTVTLRSYVYQKC